MATRGRPPKAKAQPKAPDINCASVYDEYSHLRDYTLEVHGEAFLEIATDYAKRNGFILKTSYIKKTCKECGKEL